MFDKELRKSCTCCTHFVYAPFQEIHFLFLNICFQTGVQPLAFDAQAYPNPSTSSFTIKVSSNIRNERILMIVTDVAGRIIEKRANLTAGQTVQIGSQYRPGIYVVEMQQGKARAQVKLLKTVY